MAAKFNYEQSIYYVKLHTMLCFKTPELIRIYNNQSFVLAERNYRQQDTDSENDNSVTDWSQLFVCRTRMLTKIMRLAIDLSNTF